MQQHRTVSRLFASSSSSNNDNDNYQQQEGEEEECNLQKVYQQVQQQDSEWYTKFSNLLGDDEPTIPSCGDDASDSSTDGESVGDAVPADVAVEVDEDAASVQSVSTKENVDDIKSDEGNVEEVIAAEKVERPVTEEKDDDDEKEVVSRSANVDDAVAVQNGNDQPTEEAKAEEVEIQEAPKEKVETVALLDVPKETASDEIDTAELPPSSDVKKQSPQLQSRATQLTEEEDVEEGAQSSVLEAKTQLAAPSIKDEYSRRMMANDPKDYDERYDYDDDEYDDFDDDYDGEYQDRRPAQQPRRRVKESQQQPKATDYEYQDRRPAQPPQRTVNESQQQPNASESQPNPSSSAATEMSSSTSSSPPKIVRLRNTHTSEIENLSPLPTLLQLGYSTKELLVLRPQVLELIVEDGIPKPDKGLPKRWVRLNKLEGYENVDYEDDEMDVDWEVEVVDGKKKPLPRMEDEEEERSFDYEEKEEEDAYPNDEVDTPESIKIEPETFDDDDEVMDLDEQATPQKETASTSDEQQPNQPPSREGKEEVSESWGPFTSSRVSDEPTLETAKGEKEEVAKQQQPPTMQPPTKAYDDDNVEYESMYDDERDGYDRRPQPQKRQQPQSRDSDENGDESRSYTQHRKSPTRRRSRDTEQPQQRRRRRRPEGGGRRELQFDQGGYGENGDEPPPNKFWMDLPTFRDFLQTEAKLRLGILGPDWKESVLDESRWRYDLYSTWLTMLDEGVGGDNPLYEYGDRPRPSSGRRRQQQSADRERRRPPPQPQTRDRRDYDDDIPPPRPRQRQRRQQERDLDDEDDEGDYDRPRRQQREGGERQRRPRSSRRREDRPDYDEPQPPPRPKRTSWKNFSDLEESLTRSSQESMARSSMAGEYDYEEEDEEEEPRQRRRRRAPQEPEFDDDEEGEPPASSRRRARQPRQDVDDEEDGRAPVRRRRRAADDEY